jgi:hypothetical protein
MISINKNLIFSIIFLNKKSKKTGIIKFKILPIQKLKREFYQQDVYLVEFKNIIPIREYK